jgi:hypothetical protein
MDQSSAADQQLGPLTQSGNDLLIAIDAIVQATRPKRKAAP